MENTLPQLELDQRVKADWSYVFPGTGGAFPGLGHPSWGIGEECLPSENIWLPTGKTIWAISF